MYDFLGQIIMVKVKSHQLNADFTPRVYSKEFCPNLFVTSANQTADNATNQAQTIYKNRTEANMEYYYYPPFSPKWKFSFDGRLINKGAMKLFYVKYDEELILRQ